MHEYLKSLQRDKAIVWDSYLDFLRTMKRTNLKENINISSWYLGICSSITKMMQEVEGVGDYSLLI